MGEFRCSSILKTMKSKCRVWWPAHLSPTTQPQSSTFLFGWFVTSSSSSSASVPLEVIVAFLIDEAAFSSIGSDLEGILHKINKRMPTSLQNRCGLSMLGYCSASSSSNGHLGQQFEQIISEDTVGHQICGCHKVDGSLEHYKDFTKSDSIQLLFPILISTYIVIYGTPRFGRHHFSLGTQHSSDHAKKISRKPEWVEGLNQKKPVLDLDTVILATNCAAAATSFFEEQVSPHRPSHFYVHIFKFITLIWQLLAVFVASVSTSVYIVLQLLHFLISYGLESFIYVTLHNLFPHTSRNIRVRCCQILYWPIFLHTNDSRSGSCVEYAEKASQRRHSMWLSVVIDILLGNLFGLTLLTHANSACLTILTFTGDVTNNWWLISCARLMGNPAGFKLNTELAGVLGTLSLNAIQFWSTVLGSMRFLFIFFIKGLAISGVIFGITTPAALTLDMITISTTHISTLHWLISLIYSRQIQATTALWRLFRGQKWNPLRERLDSYDYTVEQHIVGSLLFTPLLLVLPTTSAFYMSFTIMYTTIGFILMIIEIFSVDLKESVGSDVLVSSLHSYSYTLGELVKPHFSYLRSAVSRSSISSSVYGVFSGRSLSSRLYKLPVAPGAGVDGKMPWMWIPLKEYWMLCYDAVFACNPAKC
ncbi:unnamed protein product [Lactuca saligna]|uniref:Uncharacterized protein n=1 Tax=Lactuca saligna TaxID=75948 RepID=A0AA35YJ48_LACSI|nr:unnamed protein product [Lactuca saligna]